MIIFQLKNEKGDFLTWSRNCGNKFIKVKMNGKQSFINHLVEALKDCFKDNLLEIILFGSKARGEGKSFSDWGIFIIGEDGLFEFEHGRWSKAALSAQLSVEKSAKAVISLFGPLTKTNDLAGTLLELRLNPIPVEQSRWIEKLAELTEKFGVKEHVLTSYGDEVALKTPHQIYDRSKAKRAIEMAQNALKIATQMIEKISSTLTTSSY